MSSCNDLTKPKFNTPLCKPHPCIAQSRENIISPLIPNYKIQQQHSHPPPPLTRPRSASASPFYQPNRNPTPGPRLCHPQTPQTLVISPYYIRPKKKRGSRFQPPPRWPPQSLGNRNPVPETHPPPCPAHPGPARADLPPPKPTPLQTTQKPKKGQALGIKNQVRRRRYVRPVPSRPVPVSLECTSVSLASISFSSPPPLFPHDIPPSRISHLTT